MADESKLPKPAVNIVSLVRDFQNDVAKAVAKAYSGLEEVVAEKYKNQEWDKRRNDFAVVEKLAEKHSSILEFIGEYILDPLYVTARDALHDSDLVTVITIHSVKGTERETCYVLNVSPQAFPTSFAIGNADKVEEERRGLYVALTRAKDELIITRLNSLPEDLLAEQVYQQSYRVFQNGTPEASSDFNVGIKID